MSNDNPNGSGMDAALSHPTCILLVEDNPGDADLIRVLLRKSAEQPVETLHAERLSEAIEILAARPVQAVLLDLNLPDSSGIATVEAIHRAAPAVPVVVLTGQNDKSMGLAAVQAGAQDFLPKGQMSGEAIWRVLRYAVERQRALAQVDESQRFLQASLDALSARVTILDQDGRIRLANRAWRESVQGPGTDQAEAVPDYLTICARMGSGDPTQLAALGAGIRDVTHGNQECFAMEYCCEGPEGALWFQVRVTRFPAADGICVAVTHEDITLLKTAELREARLASVLRGVRNVNQLITKESDPQRLIQAACENLTETISYRSAWIALFADSGQPMVGGSGLDDSGAALLCRLRNADWPPCVGQVLQHEGVLHLRGTATTCRECHLAACGGRRLLARLELGGEVFGIMAVVAPETVASDPEEHALLEELADDIAFALHKIDLSAQRHAAEEALAASEGRYRTLFENAPIGIFATTESGRTVEANPALAQMLGCASAQDATSRYTDLGTQLYTDPESRMEFLAALRRDGQVRDFEYEARSADGRQLWLRMDARIAAQDADGMIRIEGFTTDVTQRRLAEERLQQSERRYRLLADNTIDCIWLMALDGTLQYVNPAIRQLLGYAPEEVVGTSFGRYCDSANLAFLQAALTEGLAHLPQTESAVIEAYLLRRDGTPVAVEVSARVILDEQGRPAAVQGVARDITERQQAMAAIRSRENLLNRIFDVLPVGLWLADANGNLFRSNEAGRRIWGAEHLVGREEFGVFKARRLPSREELGPADWALARTLQDHVLIRNELLEIDAFDGVQRIILNSTAPVLNEAGKLEAAVVVNLDVTEQHRVEAEKAKLEEQIQRSQRLESIGRLAGGVAHDLNNLLSPILGYTELLLDDPAVVAPHCRDSLQEIAHAGARARDLVAQLLAFGRRQLLQFQVLDLNHLLSQFSNLLRRTIREDVDITILPCPGLPAIRADAGRVEQVIMNLVVNAQDAMPDGGVITIETELAELDAEYASTHEGVAPGRYVMLAVSDTGKGMDAETLAQIFEPFYTTKEKGKGTGLGLATVYGIVRQHGGSIRVRSEPNCGATFEVYLPVASQPAPPAEKVQPTDGAARGAGTVLVVEDNEQVKGLALAVLKRQGYAVLSAGNGREALQILAAVEGGIDLLLTDVVMPEMSGRELHRRVAERFPAIKVLYMSGYTDNAIAHRGAIDAGVDFIQKPFSVKALADKIAELLNRR